jgi:large subunit ribosomal protein L10
MVTKMAHVAQWKEAQVKDLIQVMTEKPVIGLVNIGGIPGPQIQKMRKSLYGKAIFKIAKIKLMLIALEEMESKKDGIIELVQTLDGQMGLVATDMNPFKLFQVLENSKAPAPVKGGETATDDIEIKEGETSFKPGPIVGELQRVGIPAAIEQGKVMIKADKVVVKAGDKISKDVATMLTRMEIYPLTVGLDLRAVYENGTIFKKTDLDIDPKQFTDNLGLGSTQAFNLALNVGYTNDLTIQPIIQLAHGRAMNLAINANIISPLTIDHMLTKGSAHMLNIATRLNPDALDPELQDKLGSVAIAEEPPQEEKKEEDKDKGKDKDKEKKKAKEEKEEVSEEDAAAGLGALFD